ncbi:MAG: hypothetical protein GC136_10465 [Alphaproteobacteria bacterium]|nr:hypothetical protein [Alphaproteobacteria bacterium]
MVYIAGASLGLETGPSDKPFGLKLTSALNVSSSFSLASPSPFMELAIPNAANQQKPLREKLYGIVSKSPLLKAAKLTDVAIESGLDAIPFFNIVKGIKDSIGVLTGAELLEVEGMEDRAKRHLVYKSLDLGCAMELGGFHKCDFDGDEVYIDASENPVCVICTGDERKEQVTKLFTEHNIDINNTPDKDLLIAAKTLRDAGDAQCADIIEAVVKAKNTAQPADGVKLDAFLMAEDTAGMNVKEMAEAWKSYCAANPQDPRCQSMVLSQSVTNALPSRRIN